MTLYPILSRLTEMFVYPDILIQILTYWTFMYIFGINRNIQIPIPFILSFDITEVESKFELKS